MYDNVRLIHLKAGDNGDMNKLALYGHLDDFFKELEKFRDRESVDYDLIHSHYWLSGRVGSWAHERWKVPHVFMFHTVGAVKNSTVGSEKEPELRTAIEKNLARKRPFGPTLWGMPSDDWRCTLWRKLESLSPIRQNCGSKTVRFFSR